MRHTFLAVIALTFLSGASPMPAAADADPDLDMKVGQMIMVGFRGLSVTNEQPIARDIRQRRIGGVILFDYDVPSRTYGRNIESPGQLRALTSSLKRLAGYPLFIAVDQEGGRISRLKEKNGFPPTLSQKRLGALDDVKKTARQAELTARTLAGLGINLNFVSVVDLDLNPENPVIGKLERSFSRSPATVTRHALAVIDAHRRNGVVTAPKHFPGHGSAAGDTHEGFVDVTDRWTALELEPFRSLIRQDKADMVMTAHVFNGIALIIRSDYDQPGIQFFTPANFSQLVAFMRHPAGHKIAAHVHNLQLRQVLNTQEVLFLRRGKIKVNLYSTSRDPIGSRILCEGDLILLCGGGHSLEMLEESSMI